MKTTSLVIAVVLAMTAPGMAQKKPAQTEKAPTQKEMEALMKQAQDELDNLDPEARQMMDSMGIRMPSFTEMPQVTDAQLATAFENENRLVPVRDAARIASMPKTPLSQSAVPGFVSGTHAKVAAKLKPAAASAGEEVYRAVRAGFASSTEWGNAAVGMWMSGKPELAIYLMGRACVDDPAHTVNLGNYAAMLSMCGAEQMALPLLNYLNKRHRRNSTILNNIGQAWYGLGEADKAAAFLDSAIRLFPNHSQANYTKSFIEESKGNTPAAVAAVKRSTKRAYSQEKEDRLRKLGSDLGNDDLNWDRPMPQDPMGLEKFNWPGYPSNAGSSDVLEKQWAAFREACRAEIGRLKEEQEVLHKAAVIAMQKRPRELTEAAMRGRAISGLPMSATKASIKLKYLIEGKDGQLGFGLKTRQQAVMNAILHAESLHDKLGDDLARVDSTFEDRFGEGKENPFEAACSAENSAIDAFLSGANTVLEQAQRDYLNFLRRKLNDETYYYQYTQWPEDFELTKVSAKIFWLGAISEQKVMFHSRGKSCDMVQPQPPKALRLAAFDDVHCLYHSELVTPVGTIRTDCSRVTTTFDLKVIKLGLKQDMEKGTFADQFMTCSVEVGIGTGAGFAAGPLKAEASIGAGIAAEFDRTGLTDVVVKTSASAGAGTNIVDGGSMAGVGVSDLSVEIGVKGQISLVSGRSSVQSTGILDGVFQK